MGRFTRFHIVSKVKTDGARKINNVVLSWIHACSVRRRGAKEAQKDIIMSTGFSHRLHRNHNIILSHYSFTNAIANQNT